MATISEILSTAKLLMSDHLSKKSAWQWDHDEHHGIQCLLRDAIEIAYQQGRDDQAYKDKGPSKIRLYNKN